MRSGGLRELTPLRLLLTREFVSLIVDDGDDDDLLLLLVLFTANVEPIVEAVSDN